LKKFLNPKVLSEYIETLCAEKGHPDTLRDAMLSQVRKLREIYGDSIPKDDFLTIMAQQQNALKTGYKKQPVDILEFLLSTEYLNLEGTLRPKIKDALVEVFTTHNHCYEIAMGGATRIGKTYMACAAFAYHVYKLSCLYNPQTHYKLSPGSEIIFVMQSLTEAKANRNFREFYGMISDSVYFKEHFKLQGTAKNYAVFPNNIVVKPISSKYTAGLSENIFAAFIDEANFMQVIKGSVYQGLDEQYYDQATKLYQVIKDRIQNQFADFSTGEWPGKLYLASSANHTNDFIQNKKKEAKTANHIYVMDYALWEVKEGMNPSGKKFWVKMPSETESGEILDKKPKDMSEDIIEIPIELKDQFEQDLHAAIRNVAGKPLSLESKFITSASISASNTFYNGHYNYNQIFLQDDVFLNDIHDLKSLLNIPFIQAINPYFIFHSHCDVGYSHDSAGIAIGAAVGAKSVKTMDIRADDKVKDVEEVTAYAPIYAIFGLLRIKPPTVGQTDVSKIEKLYLTIKHYLTNLNSFTTDRAYSIVLIQNLRKNGIATNLISVDKNADAYIEKKNCLIEHRCWLPNHEAYKEELKHLMFNAEKNKVDHHALTAKDVSDSVAGTIYMLSKRKSSYKKKDYPLKLAELMKNIDTTDNLGRPKLNERPRSNNRPSKWRRI
jgi:hypothetical protein